MLSFIHISDLHIGKRLSGYELHDDQEYMLRELESIIEKRKPDAVFIAGDVYDRINPAEESTALLSGFLERLQSGSSEIFVIAGNHDPGEKLSYLSNIVGQRPSGKPEGLDVSVFSTVSVSGLPVALHPCG